MKVIQLISDMIEEELEGAEEYIECAIKYREHHPSLAKAFYDISLAEMQHVNVLHTEVSRLIEDHRRKNGEPPAAMLAVYNYLHGKQIDAAAEVKAMQDMYKR